MEEWKDNFKINNSGLSINRSIPEREGLGYWT